jgi:hypothetical protein
MQPLLFVTLVVTDVFRYGLTIECKSNNMKKSISEVRVFKRHFLPLSVQNTEFTDLIRDRKWELVPQITGLHKLYLFTEYHQPVTNDNAVNNL